MVVVVKIWRSCGGGSGRGVASRGESGDVLSPAWAEGRSLRGSRRAAGPLAVRGRAPPVNLGGLRAAPPALGTRRTLNIKVLPSRADVHPSPAGEHLETCRFAPFRPPGEGRRSFSPSSQAEREVPTPSTGERSDDHAAGRKPWMPAGRGEGLARAVSPPSLPTLDSDPHPLGPPLVLRGGRRVP